METTQFDVGSLPIIVNYVGETTRDGWKCDQWRIEFKNKNSFWSTDYYTGLGCRSKPKSKWDTAKPQKPKNIDILYSLFLDADAANENFDDWCDNYGYSNNSIKALNIYKSCLETATAIRKYFSPEQRECIKSIIETM